MARGPNFPSLNQNQKIYKKLEKAEMLNEFPTIFKEIPGNDLQERNSSMGSIYWKVFLSSSSRK